MTTRFWWIFMGVVIGAPSLQVSSHACMWDSTSPHSWRLTGSCHRKGEKTAVMRLRDLLANKCGLTLLALHIQTPELSRQRSKGGN